jgi:hypothetical protein
MSLGRVGAALSIVAAASIVCVWAVARGASEPAQILCHKLEAPIDLVLRPLEERPADGRCRLEVRAAVRAPLTELRLRVKPPAGARLLQGPPERAVRLKPGEALRDELLFGWEPGHGGTLFVTVEGRLGTAVLSKTQSFDLGPVEHRELQGTVRTDAHGRTFFEVRADGGEQP